MLRSWKKEDLQYQRQLAQRHQSERSAHNADLLMARNERDAAMDKAREQRELRFWDVAGGELKFKSLGLRYVRLVSDSGKEYRFDKEVLTEVDVEYLRELKRYEALESARIKREEVGLIDHAFSAAESSGAETTATETDISLREPLTQKEVIRGLIIVK